MRYSPAEPGNLGCASGGCAASRERCLFTSVMMLGALFGLMASPAARVPLVSIFVVAGVPLMTFAIAAPSRLGLLREVGLIARGLEAFGLAALCTVLGRFGDARAVMMRQRVRVENAYSSETSRLGAVIATDPLRLHHVRRLAFFGTMLTIVAGNVLPLLHPDTYTWGSDWTAPFVFALDVLVIGLSTRVVTERMAIRLLEAGHALGGGHPMAARFRVVPLTTMLGAAMGCVGALVVLAAASTASAIETSWVMPGGSFEEGWWFLRTTAPLALPLGIGIGAILGTAAGLAQPPRD